MSTLLDIIGATIIGGMLLITALAFLDRTNQHSFSCRDDLIVQENLTSTTAILEHDLKKMGYGIAEWEQVVFTADSDHIVFRSDIDRDDVVDVVEYYSGDCTDLANTPNPDDRILYRKVNGEPSNGFKVGVVSLFNFDYLNQDGNELDTSIPDNLIAIKMVRITLKVESSFVYGSDPNPEKTAYRTAFWQQTRLVSRNLRR
ncbi:MAG: hypothetical protein ACOY90_00640 [Candidatus Zhuqueibacterota bacterium]